MRGAAAAVALAVQALPGLAATADCRFDPPAAAAAVVVPAGTRIGLALGSGSMHGYAHIGVLQEIEARGLPVAVVTGTSAGAVVGGLWASGMSAARIDEIARPEALDLAEIAGSWQGLYSSEPMREPLEKAFGGRPIETWPRRFGAVAAELSRGERRLIASGDGVVALQASSATPVLFLPVIVRGERLVDGALVEPVPIDAARDLGANLVIGVDVAYRPHEEPASGLTAYAFQAMHILVNSLAASQARSADVYIRLNLHKRWMDCGRDGLVAAGRAAVASAWPELRRALLARAAARAR
ncbi:MAG TPA: patatin-like phospholipase family protein [Usitatibacter sp.]|nr:patatin-like phospholipase family protein [Usitatibacter sp.]